nr:SUMF1/EgtB/PvdO family nonheme iron enzyme [Sorangium cellulosum]
MTGDGKWGQTDLAGNMWEWVLDGHGDYSPLCNNCAELTAMSNRVLRSGSWDYGAPAMLSSRRHNGDPSVRHYSVGVRCERTP